MEISFKSVNDILEFVGIVSRFQEEVEVSTKKSMVNGKSVLGMFSLDLSKPVKVTAKSDRIYEAIRKYAA